MRPGEEDNKLLLLDKDGTLVRPKSRKKFVDRPRDQKRLPGAKDAIAHYYSKEWAIVLISNQAGVEAGHKTLESCILEIRYCLELFPEIHEAFFCPDSKGSECHQVRRDDVISYGPNSPLTLDLKLKNKYRKPNPGMLWLARSLNCGDNCLYVGDRPEDEAAAQAAGIPFLAADVWRALNPT